MTQGQLPGRWPSPSRGPLLHEVYIYTIYYISHICSCSLCLPPAAPTLLVQGTQAAVDATAHQWPWPALADVWGWEFISSYNSTALLVSGAYQLLGASPTAPTPPALFTVRFAGSCFSIHIPGYQQNPRACSHTRELQEFYCSRTIAQNLCYI